MTDEIIKELWHIKDDIAREHSDDLDRLVADLKSKERTEKTRDPVDSTWPDRVKALVGAWRDEPWPEDLRSPSGQDVPREPF